MRYLEGVTHRSDTLGETKVLGLVPTVTISNNKRIGPISAYFWNYFKGGDQSPWTAKLSRDLNRGIAAKQHPTIREQKKRLRILGVEPGCTINPSAHI